MRTLEHRVPPPLVGLVLAIAMWAISSLPPSLGIQSTVRPLAVAILCAIGLGFDLLGVIAFLRRRTTINPLNPSKASALVTTGIYRITRNPMYVGVLLLLAAWAVHLNALWPWLGPAVFVPYMNRFQIAPEERVLVEKFGDEFSNYVARVRRWL